MDGTNIVSITFQAILQILSISLTLESEEDVFQD